MRSTNRTNPVAELKFKKNMFVLQRDRAYCKAFIFDDESHKLPAVCLINSTSDINQCIIIEVTSSVSIDLKGLRTIRE